MCAASTASAARCSTSGRPSSLALNLVRPHSAIGNLAQSSYAELSAPGTQRVGALRYTRALRAPPRCCTTEPTGLNAGDSQLKWSNFWDASMRSGLYPSLDESGAPGEVLGLLEKRELAHRRAIRTTNLLERHGYSRRQRFANAAIAGSRVALLCIGRWATVAHSICQSAGPRSVSTRRSLTWMLA